MRALFLEREIERLLDAENYSLAVIVSQTMLELRVEQEVRHLAEGFDADSFGEAALGLISSFNLSRRTQKFLETALGIRFSTEMPAEIKALRTHYALRNRIVHEGEAADREQARASFKAVRDITWRLHQLTYRRLGWDPTRRRRRDSPRGRRPGA